MRCYFDSSALAKRVTQEEESESLRAFISSGLGHSFTGFTSRLARLECARLLRRTGVSSDVYDEALEAMLNGIELVPMHEAILRQAERINDSLLRSLDAIHVTTALAVTADAVVTYDERMRWAAFSEGMAIIQPGLTRPTLPESWEWIEASSIS